jgi:hypothetical protein
MMYVSANEKSVYLNVHRYIEAVGFQVVVEEAEDETEDPRAVVLHESIVDMAPLNAALRRLSPLAPHVAAQLAAPKPPPPVDPRKPPPGGRAPKVFLPAAVCAAAVTEFSDDYFQRDAADVQVGAHSLPGVGLVTCTTLAVIN